MPRYARCKHCMRPIKQVGFIRKEWVTVLGGHNGCTHNRGKGHEPL